MNYNDTIQSHTEERFQLIKECGALRKNRDNLKGDISEKNAVLAKVKEQIREAELVRDRIVNDETAKIKKIFIAIKGLNK